MEPGTLIFLAIIIGLVIKFSGGNMFKNNGGGSGKGSGGSSGGNSGGSGDA